MTNFTEQNRRLDNLIRFGLIEEVDCTAAKARVKCGQISTDFLPFLTLRSGTTRTWSPPTVGEQCVILATGGELTTACILTGLYTQNAPTADPDLHSIVFADGAEIHYHQASEALIATGIQTATITAAQQITLNCPTITLNGNVNISGSLDTSGNMQTQGHITAAGDITGGNISLQNHVHREQGDGADTGRAK